MRISIPAGAYYKAALKKRKGQTDGAEGSTKRPRSHSPSAPQTDPNLPTPPPPRRRSPVPSPPRAPRRSPAPLPPRRSPTPLPPPEFTNQMAETTSRESGAFADQPTEHPDQPTVEQTPREEPQTSRGASVDRRQKAVVGYETRRATSEPTGDKAGPVSSRPSLMNHSHLAAKLLSGASTPAIREEIMRTNPRTLVKDGQIAMLRVSRSLAFYFLQFLMYSLHVVDIASDVQMVNVFNHVQALMASGDRRADRLQREAIECRNRATQAEDDLKLTQAGEAERLEIVRSQARTEVEAATQQMRKTLERAMMAEGKLMAAEAELAEIKTQLDAAKSELRASEDKIEIAEEVARLADIKAAEAVEAVNAADRRVADVAEKAVESYRNSSAFTKDMADAVKVYRNSAAFVEEVAEAGADAYLQGFCYCRDKAVRIFGVQGLKDLEPEEGDPEGEGVSSRSALAADSTPPAETAPVQS